MNDIPKEEKNTTVRSSGEMLPFYLIGSRIGKKPEEISHIDIYSGILVIPKTKGGGSTTGIVIKEGYNYFVNGSNASFTLRYLSFVDLYHDLSPYFNFYSV